MKKTLVIQEMAPIIINTPKVATGLNHACAEESCAMSHSLFHTVKNAVVKSMFMTKKSFNDLK